MSNIYLRTWCTEQGKYLVNAVFSGSTSDFDENAFDKDYANGSTVICSDGTIYKADGEYIVYEA